MKRNYKNISLQLRMAQAGIQQRDIARVLDVSPATICRWLQAEPMDERHRIMVQDAMATIGAAGGGGC